MEYIPSPPEIVVQIPFPSALATVTIAPEIGTFAEFLTTPAMAPNIACTCVGAVEASEFRATFPGTCCPYAGTPGASVPTTKATIANEIEVIIGLRIIVSSRSSIVGNDL
jgi:hypothetical protein